MPQDTNTIIDRLCKLFPATFDRQTPKPLKIGVGPELLALAGVHPALADLSPADLRQVIKVYTRRFRYRQALAAGGPRYDLDGQPAGEVTPEQQAQAQAPRKKTAGPPSSLASSAAAPVLSPEERHALLKDVIAMAIPGKLDVTLKIHQLPQAKPASSGTMLFAVEADGRVVVVEMRNKQWNMLKNAAESYPQWVAAITGKLGEAIDGGFRLEKLGIQVFEKKAKPDTATAPAPATAEPAVASAPAPAPAPAPALKTASALGYTKMTLKGRVTPKTEA
ncbi:MAG: hypothetical protein H6976_16180 [Gammaproteobacteria bacterium]|nr:hypothetical protein [Gammaproteobacteria bacterium]